jgi:hypothetical protein
MWLESILTGSLGLSSALDQNPVEKGVLVEIPINRVDVEPISSRCLFIWAPFPDVMEDMFDKCTPSIGVYTDKKDGGIAIMDHAPL